MATEALNCSGCGAALNYSGKMVCKCEYCGVTNFLSGESIKNSNRFNRANEERQKCNFDKAIDLYDDLLDEMAPTTDILWGKTLCIFGVEYVEDPVSSEYMPTLHRIGDEDIFECESFKEALKLADDEQKDVLKKDAKAISDLNNEYIRIANEEEPYDVFICYKDTEKDEEGNVVETIDRARGTELFDQLRSRGLKVFFSHRTLKTGEMYEPQIFAALRSSAAMVLLLSNEDYINSVWLKNEWSRFRELKKKDPRRSFFVACERPERLPRWAQQQVSKLSNPGVYVDLASRIKDVLEKQYPERYATKRQDVDISAAMAEAMSKMSFGQGISSRLTEEELGKIYENAKAQNRCGNYDMSNEELRKYLKNKTDCADAYWLRMCNRLKVRESELENGIFDIKSEGDYTSAMNYADEESKRVYMEICDSCQKNREAYLKFDAKRVDIIEEYAKKKRGKELRQKFVKKEKSYKFLNWIESHILRDRIPVINMIVGFIFYALYVFLSIKFIASGNLGDEGIAFGVIIFILSGIGLVTLSTYMEKIVSISIGVMLAVLYIGLPIFIMIKTNTGNLWFIAVLIINILLLIALICGMAVSVKRADIAGKIVKDYNSAFIGYGNKILIDVNDALVNIKKERGRDFNSPYTAYLELSANNYLLIDHDITDYLQGHCMHGDLEKLF